VPASANPGPEALPASWWSKPRGTEGKGEWQLQQRGMDQRIDRGAQVASFAGPGFCTAGTGFMSGKRNQPRTSITQGDKPSPVRVRLRRINCDYARPNPPDGQTREWWQRLKNALGTSSNHFVDASLQQLIAAARLPFSGLSETAVNASLAFIGGAKPRGRG
jgi:hypothetical protein